MTNFQRLLDQIHRCQHCVSQLPLAPRPILQYSQHSKVLIAGQAPGKITHEKGRPFDDKSGERLRQWLNVDNASFYKPEHFAIVPMGFCYPGKGKSGDLPPLKACAELWRNQLLAELTQLSLTIVVGQYAAQWHLKRLGLTFSSLTESVADYQRLANYNIFVLPHPSPRNNLWLKKHPWFEQQVLPLLQAKLQQALSLNNLSINKLR
ncbi:uracil-DNA glycosylase family protein [Colwellia sp. MEBiC06753]